MKEEFLNIDHPIFVDEIDWDIQYKDKDFNEWELIQYVNEWIINILRSKEVGLEDKQHILYNLLREKNTLALI